MNHKGEYKMEIIDDDNPVTVEWETTEKTLIKKQKHQKPIEKIESWDIDIEKQKVARYMRIAKMWEDKCIPHQQRIDMHTKEHGKL